MLVTARKFKERGAISGDEIETLEPIDKAARPSLDEGGLFPDIVAAETETPEDDDEMPLLKSQSVGGES